ncbi:MAG TPA: acyl carrier protein [Candidatus Deferrimicrobiaceae bacterium]|jgi:acyl carrier protein
MSTNEQVRSALEAFARAPVPADDDASLFDAGVLDSFGLMEFIGELEQQFGVKVPDEELTPRKFETVAKVAAWFDARRRA